jgi:type IV secretory pathway VirJ component
MGLIFSLFSAKALAALRSEESIALGRIALPNSEHSVDLGFRVADCLPGRMADTPCQIQQEVERFAGRKLLCIYGSDEPAPPCPYLDPKQFKAIEMSGGHHFGGDYKSLAHLILRESR